ncbi:MAG TPA: small basic protein [Tepidisphaeraceae bacterium]|jgi:small basic protein (TIGR04137 family)
MSLDASLKAANALVRHRNVLTRDERLAKLKEEEKWQDGRSILGLPKVAHRKMAVGGKGGAKEEAAEGAAATPGAPAAAAPAAKGAAPAAKGAAAPAAKAAAPAGKKK